MDLSFSGVKVVSEPAVILEELIFCSIFVALQKNPKKTGGIKIITRKMQSVIAWFL